MQHPAQGSRDDNPTFPIHLIVFFKGCSPQSSGADPVAAKAAQNAISENERIFPIFAQRLASNEPKEFVNTTRKLATWLSSEKAYYAAARPKVSNCLTVKLAILISQLTRLSSFLR